MMTSFCPKKNASKSLLAARMIDSGRVDPANSGAQDAQPHRKTRPMRYKRYSAFIFLFALSVSSTGFAATVRPLSLEDLGTKADKIVHARVLGVNEDFGSKDNAFRTRLQFEIIETIKGEASPIFEMVLPGGQAGNLFSWIPGMPRFELHDEVVLFLEANPNKSYAFMGLAQGVFFVDYRRGLPTLKQRLQDTHFIGAKKQPLFTSPNNLRDFLKLVRSYARGVYR